TKMPYIGRGRGVSALHEFDADTIRRGNVAQQAAANAFLQLDREAHAFLAQVGAEGRQVTLVQETEMIGAPGVVAGEIGIGPDRLVGCRILPGAAATDQDRHAAELDEDLRGPAGDGVGGNGRAEHLDIPGGRCLGVFADDVDVIEFEGGIVHGSILSDREWYITRTSLTFLGSGYRETSHGRVRPDGAEPQSSR